MRDGIELISQGEEHQPNGDNERRQPGCQQSERSGRRKETEQGVVRLAAATPEEADQPPRSTNHVPPQPEPAGRRARHNDRLKKIPHDQAEQQGAQREGDQFHAPIMSPGSKRARQPGLPNRRPLQRGEHRLQGDPCLALA